MSDIDICNALLTNFCISCFNDQFPPLSHTCKDFYPVMITLWTISALKCLSLILSHKLNKCSDLNKVTVKMLGTTVVYITPISINNSSS